MSRLDELLRQAGALPVEEPTQAPAQPSSRLDELLRRANAVPVEGEPNPREFLDSSTSSKENEEGLPYNEEQNRAQGNPYPDYVFTDFSGARRLGLNEEQMDIRNKYLEQKREDQFRKLKLYGQSALRAPLTVPDIGHNLYNAGASITNALGLTDAKPYTEEELPSHHIRKALQDHTPINLNAYEPQTKKERIGTAGIEGGVGTLASLAVGTGAKIASKVVPYFPKLVAAIPKVASKVFGSANTSGQALAATGIGSGIGGGVQALQEEGVNVAPLVAGVALGLPAYGAVKNAAKGIKKIIPKGPAHEGFREASRHIENIVGKDNIPGTLDSINRGLSEKSSYGHRPTTAELANNPGISIAQETLRGSLAHPDLPESISSRSSENYAAKNKALSKFRGEGSEGATAAQEYLTRHEDARAASKDASLKNALEPLSKHTPSERAGQVVRKAMQEELDAAKAERHKKVGDKYDVVKNLEERVPSTRALKVLQDEMSTLGKDSKLRKRLEYVLKQVGSDNAYDRKGNVLLKTNKRASELAGARGEINGLLGEAYASGDKNLARIYRSVIEGLDLDLESHPQIGDAWKTYAKESKRVNAIESDPVFSSILKKTDYGSGYNIPDSGVLKKLVNSAESSKSVAQKFKGIFGKNKKMMSEVEGYINKKVFDKILDQDGVPTEAKINQYRKNNEGAFELYDHLDVRLENTRNATKFLNDVGNKAYNETTKQYKEMFKTVTGSKPEKMAQQLFESRNSKDKIKALYDILKQDETGKALEGGRRAVIDYVSAKSKTPTKFTEFYKNHPENLLEAFGEGSPEMKFLGELNERYLKRLEVEGHASVGNRSHTASALKTMGHLKELQKSLGKTILDDAASSAAPTIVAGFAKGPVAATVVAGTKGGWKWYRNAVRQSMEKVVQESLLDANYMKMVLEDLSKKGGEKAAKGFMRQWRLDKVNGYAVSQFGKNSKEEEK